MKAIALAVIAAAALALASCSRGGTSVAPSPPLPPAEEPPDDAREAYASDAGIGPR